jgi:hypothetical protein
MVLHIFNPNTQEVKAEGLRVQGQPELLTKPCLKKNKEIPLLGW